MAEPSFSIGIEEEYFLVDCATRAAVVEPPPTLVSEVQAALGGEQVSPELLRSQIEVQTCVCEDTARARSEVARARRAVADVAGRYGLGVIAASTHPLAEWDEQRATPKERYAIIARDLQGPGRRLVICGMHVHVGIDDDDLRIDLMNQATYFLPHLLALSTSSPFWRGRDTGLKSYRISVFNEIPRTGLPDRLDSWGEYQRRAALLIACGLIEDPTKLWWDIRPSHRFPTLEMRITDICTRLDDAIAIAALFRCLMRMLWRLKAANQRWRIYPRMLVEENRWRAQRYGFDEGLVDFGRGRILPFADLLEELILLVGPDADHFGCRPEIEHCRTILAHGTSAHRQVVVFRAAKADGADDAEALRAVVDGLMEWTLDGA